MPMATVELHADTTTPGQRRAISDGIHLAMKEALGIPDDDRFHVFHALPAGSMFHDDLVFGRARDDHFMFVTLSFNNRTAAQKDHLYRALVHHLGEQAGVKPEDLLIRIVETARENWWAAGRVINPETGYDERMTVEEPSTG